MNARTVLKVETVPDWLTPVPVNALAEKKALQDHQFDILFERLLDRAVTGTSLKDFLEHDVREIERAAFMRWIRADEDRRQRYYDAMETYSDIVVSEVLDIADGIGDTALPEDVRRSEVKINARKWVAGVFNRRKYGDVKQVEITQNISIRAALSRGEERVLEGHAVRLIERDED